MPEFRREVPCRVCQFPYDDGYCACQERYVRHVPEDAPPGTFYCSYCDEFHYPGEPCSYWDGDTEEDRAIGAEYPEWSGVLETHYDHDHIFVNEQGEER